MVQKNELRIGNLFYRKDTDLGYGDKVAVHDPIEVFEVRENAVIVYISEDRVVHQPCSLSDLIPYSTNYRNT